MALIVIPAVPQGIETQEGQDKFQEILSNWHAKNNAPYTQQTERLNDMPDMIRITALSRQDAEVGVYGDKDYVISITDPGSYPANIRSKNILRLQFWDIYFPSQYYLDSRMSPPITLQDARKIVNFVRQIPMDAESITVHCEMGISRSTGCAAAIARYLYNDDMRFFMEKRPNPLVYGLVYKELEKSGIKQSGERR